MLGLFLVCVLGYLCAKTARNAARFSFLRFVGCLGFLFDAFWKVFLGLGLCPDQCCVGNCSPLIGPSGVLVWCGRQHVMLPVFLF